MDAARGAGRPIRTGARGGAHADADVGRDTPSGTLPPELRLRSIRDGEDQAVVDALNRNWTGTWNFVEIPYDMLQEDLAGQREGMLLAVDADDRIVATCHAVYEADRAESGRQPAGVDLEPDG